MCCQTPEIAFAMLLRLLGQRLQSYEPRIEPANYCQHTVSPEAPCFAMRDVFATRAKTLPLVIRMRHRRHTCFFNLMTLKRSKSLNCLRLKLLCLLFANELLDHLLSTSASVHFFFSPACPIPRGSFSMTMPVRDMYDSRAEWRGTAACGFSEGPSTRT